MAALSATLLALAVFDDPLPFGPFARPRTMRLKPNGGGCGEDRVCNAAGQGTATTHATHSATATAIAPQKITQLQHGLCSSTRRWIAYSDCRMDARNERRKEALADGRIPLSETIKTEVLVHIYDLLPVSNSLLSSFKTADSNSAHAQAL